MPTHYEFMMVTKAGESRWVDFSPAQIRYQGGSAIIGTGFDITERKRAEAALIDSEARLQLLTATATRLLNAESPQAILGEIFESVAAHMGADVFLNYMVAPDGGRLYLNAWRGIEEGTAKAMGHLEFSHPYCAQVARDRQPLVLDHVQDREVGGDDILRRLGVRAYASHPLMDDSILGTISFCARSRDQFTEADLGMMRAVADQVSIALSRQNLTRALAQRAISLDRANKAKDHFLAVLSHELRTPLTPVVPALAMLQDDRRLDSSVRETLDLIRRNVELEARLIDDLLDITRIAHGKIELDRRVATLSSIVASAVDVCRSDIEARQLRFSVDTKDADSVMVFADASRLQQVFWNLLKNAIKFTEHGGRVAVRCYRDGPAQVVTEITDNGVGIENEALGRIFNAFEQGEPAIRRQFGGLGLGLAISKTIIALHGGTITAQSAGRNMGSTFCVRMPVCSPTSDEAKPSRHPPAPVRAHDARSLSILLVEDHGDTARVLARLLSARGHRVQIAADVAGALALASPAQPLGAEPFDLMISDLGLPDGSGTDLLRELRRRGSHMPGIALSGFGQEADIQQSREAGFCEHLTKPVTPGRLAQAIAAASADAPT